MTVRLVLVARGTWRWIPVSAQVIIDESNDKIVQRAEELNSQITPKLTGRLRESFDTEKEERAVRFFWTAPYAQYVDEGFPKSEGRYVPVIDKRLVSKQLSPRTQVFREALGQGFSKSAARVARTIKIYRTKALPAYVDGRFERTPGAKPRILIREGLSKDREAVTLRHELWHAVEYAQEKRYLEVESESEERARFFSIKSGLQERNIGMHPGFKGHQFVKSFLDQLREESVAIVEEVISRRIGI